MKKLLTILLLLTYGICSGQNLVPNGDFEQYWHCPTGGQQLDSAKFWTKPTAGTPDYYNQCGTGTQNVPYTGYGFQHAHSGVGFGALIQIWYQYPNYREYIESPILSTTNSLEANHCYHFEMYINLANVCLYSSHNIGVYFSDSIINDSLLSTHLLFIPQIINPPGNLADTLNWTLVSGNYTAHGGESYLIIGNFDNTSSTTVDSLPFGVVGYPWARVNIDDVSLTPISCTVGITEQNESTLTIYPNPVIDELNVKVNNYEPTEIILYDLSSRKLLQQTFTNTTTKKTIYANAITDF